MTYFTLNDFNFNNKYVLLRVDFNVPLEKGMVSDNKKIKEALPTIKYLIENKAIIILISHLGRPQGIVEGLRLCPVYKELQKLLRRKGIYKLDDCLGQKVEEFTGKMMPGEIVLLENIQFHPGEKENDLNFAKTLASYADIFIMEAFGQAHRNYASIVSIPKFLPSGAGFLMQREIKNLNKVFKAKKPLVWIIGGAKIVSKIKTIRLLLRKADKFLIGGALAFSFLKALGFNTGMSKIDVAGVRLAKKLLKKAKKKIVLPVDVVVASDFKEKAKSKKVDINEIPSHWLGLDIGPKTIGLFKKELRKAKTIVWNGPIGVFEWKKFSQGTKEIARLVSQLKAFTVVGGGESAEAIRKFGLEKKINHISTGGGACLAFLEGKKLPAIKALEKNWVRFKGKV